MHSFKLICAPAHDRHRAAGMNACQQPSYYFLLRKLLAGEILLQQFLVIFGGSFNYLRSRLRNALLKLLRHGNLRHFSAVVCISLISCHIHISRKLFSLHNGILNGRYCCHIFIFKLRKHLMIVGMLPVHLIYK